ncbi:MAG TPA: 23S rRNA (adenine(2503)-C(2))-methyltransferase RlmN [Candidatus Bathyarchaeia archaeon]|nr:23S rRNA (adenine(2503)-C(2))-methyltransferase RlmN [Candidatus Bathyarchaeia archaeon]
MRLDYLKEIFKNQPSYRLKQIKQAIFKDLVENWSQVTTLPLSLRAELNQKTPLTTEGTIFAAQNSQVIKALITLSDGEKIETVLMRYANGRNTVCLSSQVGCSLKCVFCATGKMGFKRNLTSWEIVLQALFFARFLKKNDPNSKGVTNVVFMGMGEPFLNYENVLESIRVLNDKDGFNLGIRHISISTVGITKGIRKLAGENLGINLAISLHAPTDQLRQELIPVNQKYPLKKVLSAVEDYISKTHRKVMFEYVMIKGVNDSDEDAYRLAILVKGKLAMVNLIAYNPTGIFKPSSSDRIRNFRNILEQKGIAVTQRFRFGRRIRAACGQLAVK